MAPADAASAHAPSGPQATPSTRRVGLVQMRSGLDPARNLADIETAARELAREGCVLVATPEAANIVQKDAASLRAVLADWPEARTVEALGAAARRAGVWLLAGSIMAMRADGRVANRSVLLDPDGAVRAHYDKIHLFDVTLSGGETYAESASVAPGAQAVLADSPLGLVGLSVCYDLRFAGLYRSLAQAGAQVLTAPAAFTRVTGRAHWEVLLRARAIETGSFVLAPAQGGVHADGRTTWGRSMIVGPWGETVAALDHDEPGLVVADLDLSRVATARARIPSLRHDRAFAPPQAVEAVEAGRAEPGREPGEEAS